ncbi:MAG: dipeptide epimerase [Cyclobacteriaceae bacterium]|nr:dipeptide epimerase [Cyclobacteriaceae bacterium]
MKIKEVRTYHKDLGTSRPYSIAYKTVTEVVNAFVEIELENGLVGIGAANPSVKVVGESVEDTIRTLAATDFSFLVGKSISEFEGLLRETQKRFQHLPGTNVAIDIALHDVFTKFLKVPLVRYFGQQHASLPTSITIGIKNVEETVKEAAEYHSMGFKIVKVKTGLNPEEDAERVVKIQEAFSDFVIRVDANQGYTVEDLNRFVELSKTVKLDLIEQPFKVNDFVPQISFLSDPVKELLVADETCKSPSDALMLSRWALGCRIYNIKLMKTGGLFAAREIAQIAGRSNVNLMWGCNDESAVSIAAALHLALSYSHTKYLDLDGSLDLIEDVVTGGFTISDGYMAPSTGIGLGVSFNH